jgi:benzoyl-CoA reductase/2-hydroxyglutaryl-CoA dehydratase subunit BcrC/BadD/HgdB
MITRRLQYELVGRVVAPFLMKLDQWQASRKAKRSGGRSRDLFGPPLESVRPLKALMTSYYLQGRYADRAVPVAWVTSGFPFEALQQLGYFVIYPENHAALCGARKLVPKISAAAERAGFSMDLCSYARTDIGNVLEQNTPVGRLPKPDLLCCCTNICQTVLYWYRNLADFLKVPLVLIDTPFIYGTSKEHHLQYVVDQLEEMIAIAEGIAGRGLDRAKFVEVMARARDGSMIWAECLATAKAHPSPWTGFDTFFHIAPIVTMRGTEKCNAYYRHLLDELKDRAIKGIGGIADERVRLLWDNLPIWFNVRELSALLAERGFNFVCATYSNAWAEVGSRIKPEDPLTSTAKAYTEVYLNRDLANRLETMKQLAREFDVQGAVLHSDRSCKPYSVGQIDVKRRLAEDLGIKALVLEADHGDQRLYSEEQGNTRLQAFMETFDA